MRMVNCAVDRPAKFIGFDNSSFPSQRAQRLFSASLPSTRSSYTKLPLSGCEDSRMK